MKASLAFDVNTANMQKHLRYKIQSEHQLDPIIVS